MTRSSRWRPSTSTQPTFDRITAPLKEQVKEQGLWAAHLPPELGGGGFGQVKLGLMHEILGRCRFAPGVFGNNAPDSGNAELLAIGGSDGAEGAVDAPAAARASCAAAFSMTEPGAGADPTLLATRAVLDGDEYVINGHKWFSSNASVADFLIVMCVTDPDVSPYQGSSMIIVPMGTPGVDVVRDIPTMDHPLSGLRLDGGHAEVLYRDVRVPKENLVGNPGDGFRLAQQRLGPGRIHHAMRWLGQSGRAFDMLCERARQPLHARLGAGRQADDPGLGGDERRRDAGRPAAHPARGLDDGPGRRVQRARRDRDDQVLGRARCSTT